MGKLKRRGCSEAVLRAGVPALPPHARSALAGVLREQLVVEALHAHVGRLERLQAGQVGQAAQLCTGVPMREVKGLLPP